MSETKTKKRTLCPYCGHIEPDTFERCPACGGFLDELSRRVSQQHMGPWYIHSRKMPYRPGCSYEVITKQIQSGKLKPTSILRGPTTQQFWMPAKRTPGVAHLLGYCHHCGVDVDPTSIRCPRCKAKFIRPNDRNQLGLAPYDPSVFAEVAKIQSQLASQSGTPTQPQQSTPSDTPPPPPSTETDTTDAPTTPPPAAAQVTITSMPNRSKTHAYSEDLDPTSTTAPPHNRPSEQDPDNAMYQDEADNPAPTQSQPSDSSNLNQATAWIDNAADDADDLEGILTEPIYPLNTPQASTRTVSPFVWIVIIINLLLIGIAGYLVYQQTDQTNQPSTPPLNPSQNTPDTPNSPDIRPDLIPTPNDNPTPPITTNNTPNTPSNPPNTTPPDNTTPPNYTKPPQKSDGSFFGIPTEPDTPKPNTTD